MIHRFMVGTLVLVLTAAPPAYAATLLAGPDRVASAPATHTVDASTIATLRTLRGLHRTREIPAFARKYGLVCSACHTVWPELNPFGQAFRDNGYQIGNDRDSPIWQNASYWPIAVRTTPQWHAETTTKQPIDAVPGDPNSGLVERTIHQNGLDLSGIDFLMLGTLYKNIAFGLVTTMEPTGETGIEAAYVRFSNLLHSRWVNFKFGKFELDNLLSEKRTTLLSNNGGFYQSYHFVPSGDMNDFGLGDNQIGAELSGHSINSYTRYNLAVLSSTSGNPGLVGGRTYDVFLTASHAYEAGNMGLHRIGAFAYVGRRATVDQTTGGEPIPGAAVNAEGFYRVGLTGNFSFGQLELLPQVMHASDDAHLATATPGGTPLPAGARDATWNAGILEAHYFVSPQFLITGRTEMIRMSKQGLASMPKRQGNIDVYTIGTRIYPILFSRAGLAVHTELSFTKTVGMAPLSGDGAAVDPLTPTTEVRSTSLLFALDFAF